MSDPREPDLLPSIGHLLKRAGALERRPSEDVLSVAYLPVFQSRHWRRAISEFLLWSGTTPNSTGCASVFELLLCHGPAGARVLFEAYRQDRLERASTFEEGDAQLEAVRTVISMATHWLHVIDWDLRDAPRFSAEEFRLRRQGRQPLTAHPPRPVGERAVRADRGDASLSELVDQFLLEETKPRGSRRALARESVPRSAAGSTAASLWKSSPEKSDPSAGFLSRRRPPTA